MNKHEILNSFMIYNESKKIQNGEVFTPLILVNEMLDKLPKDVWLNKNFKWLDPAVGIGNFPLIIYERLMKSLVDFKNESDKSKHILNNMLYVGDICPSNIEKYKIIMGYDKDYKGNNIVIQSFLDNKTFKDIKFDVIIGNPPYNKPGNTNTGHTIWQHFLTKSLNEMLKDDGYLVFVHPSGWRKPECNRSKFKGLFKLMTKDNTMLYLEIHNKKDGMKMFNAGTRYDWYVIHKKSSEFKSLKIKDEEGVECSIDLNEWKFLPNKNFELVKSLLGDGCNVLHRSPKNISNIKSEEFKYPLIHSTNKSGIRYMYSSRNDKGPFGVSKIIFGESGINDVVIDMDGFYGMTDGSIGIQISDLIEAENLKKALLSEKFKKVLKACSWSLFRVDWRLFTYFKKDFWKEFI